MSDPLFQGSLQDMIKGMRSNKKDPSTFLSKEIADIKTELRSTDPFLKAEAVSLFLSTFPFHPTDVDVSIDF